MSLSLRGEREVRTQRCVHVFLFAHRCQPLGGASTCELWVCFHLRVVQRFCLGGWRRRRRGRCFRVSDPQCRCVFSVHFRGGGVLSRTFARRVLLASGGLALVIFLTHGHDPAVVKLIKEVLSTFWT